jgi:uncharacterized membrane protein
MPSAVHRIHWIDTLRGLAMVWMTAFHFCFDLNHFGYIRQDFYENPVWTWQRTGILSLFLFTAGVSQAVALHQGQDWPRFWRRWAQVAACALLVTLGSYLMYPKSFIYFGTLHGIAVMLVLTRLMALALARVPTGLRVAILVVLALLLIALKFIAAHGLSAPSSAELALKMNSPSWNWLGWVNVKPITEDYVPLIPWLGVMCLGLAVGQAWMARRTQANPVAHAPAQAPLRGLAWLGRWSLSYYMVHQPVLIGALTAFKWCIG